MEENNVPVESTPIEVEETPAETKEEEKVAEEPSTEENNNPENEAQKEAEEMKHFMSDKEKIANIYLSASLFNIVKRRLKGEEFDEYEALPMEIKLQIRQIRKSSLYKNASNRDMAKMLINKLMDSYEQLYPGEEGKLQLEEVFDNIDTEFEKISSEHSAEFGDMLLGLDKDRITVIENKISKCEEEGNTELAEKAKAVLESIHQAKSLETFNEFCKDCKIKNFDLTKPQRFFDGFIRKFHGNKYGINDIWKVEHILNYHMYKSTATHHKMLAIAFCKFCKAMKAEVDPEYVYMYYVLRNIHTLDRLNFHNTKYNELKDEAKEFYDTVTHNIETCITSLLERNPRFKDM